MERETRHKSAGLRTYTLVGFAAKLAGIDGVVSVNAGDVNGLSEQ